MNLKSYIQLNVNMKNMIPKRLIFIWLGPNVPDYGYFCMDNFKKINPDFEIMFVHIPNVNNSQNQDLLELQAILNSGQKTVYSYMFDRKFAQKHMQSELGKLTSLSDALRIYLLNKYGGIYLDLDTFPVKPFDEKLLSYENGFVVNHKPKHCDYFFMGFQKNFINKNLITLYPKTTVHLFDQRVHRVKYREIFAIIFKDKLKIQADRFYKLEYKFGETVFNPNFIYEYYIDHFRKESWKQL